MLMGSRVEKARFRQDWMCCSLHIKEGQDAGRQALRVRPHEVKTFTVGSVQKCQGAKCTVNVVKQSAVSQDSRCSAALGAGAGLALLNGPGLRAGMGGRGLASQSFTEEQYRGSR